MPDLSELLERVEKAEGQNFEIDEDVWIACLGERSDGLAYHDFMPSVTQSLDAVVGLIEKEMPTAFWAIMMRGRTRGEYQACCMDKGDGHMTLIDGRTPALTLLAAFLRAKIEMEAENA